MGLHQRIVELAQNLGYQMNIKTSASLLALSSCIYAHAQTPWALSPSLNWSNDTDGLTIHKLYESALPVFQSNLAWQGIELQQQRYQQNDTQISGSGVNLTGQDIDASSGMGYTYKVGINEVSNKTLATADFNWNQALSPQVQWGVFANRDWVESMLALQQTVHYDLVGGNIDYQIHPRMTLVGSLSQSYFSDGQQRLQEKFRLVWDAWPEQGVTLQLAQKHQTGEQLANPSLYFNPRQLDETMGLLGWRRRYEGWQWYARLGWGQQQVSDQGSTPTRLTELQLSSPVRQHSYFKLRAGQSESFGYYGAGYSYRFLDAQWILQLGR